MLSNGVPKALQLIDTFRPSTLHTFEERVVILGGIPSTFKCASSMSVPVSSDEAIHVYVPKYIKQHLNEEICLTIYSLINYTCNMNK